MIYTMGNGCYIDGSHSKAIEFDIAVIDFAIEYGYQVNKDQYDADIKDYKNDATREDDFDIEECLYFTAEDAVEYLNGTVPEGLCWHIDEQSLFLEEVEEA